MKTAMQSLLLATALLGLGQIMAGPVRAQSLAMEFEHSQVSLLAGKFADDRWSAGVDIRLAPGWKTYWKVPGEAGVPPQFDWSASTNVSAVKLHWPAPARFSDPGGDVIGYKHRVVFPVDVTPSDPAKPVDLALDLHYAVCDEICIPVHAELAMTLNRNDIETGLFQTAIEEARQLVPGEAGDISVDSLQVEKHGDGYALLVGLSGNGLGAETDILVEGPEEYFFAAPEPVKTAAGSSTWRLVVEGLDKADGLKDKQLTLTILSGKTRLVRHVKVN